MADDPDIIRQRVAWMHKIATDENQLKQRVNLQMTLRRSHDCAKY
jgi:hypothetical protein